MKKAMENFSAENPECRQFGAELVNESFAANWAQLWRVVKALSGLTQVALSNLLGVSPRTIRRWGKGTIPRSNKFPEVAAKLEELTGVGQAVLHEARELSLVKREGGSGPRPAWAREYALWGLELSHYLRRLTQEHHLTYKDAAALVGYPVEDWTRWVKGETVPKMWQTKKTWRIIGAPEGVLWAEYLAARNRGARVVQARKWSTKRTAVEEELEKMTSPGIVAQAAERYDRSVQEQERKSAQHQREIEAEIRDHERRQDDPAADSVPPEAYADVMDYLADGYGFWDIVNQIAKDHNLTEEKAMWLVSECQKNF